MSEDLKQNLQRSLYNIDTKSNKIYFFVQDTKGNAKASIRFIYDIASSLSKDGYKIVMLYEKPDYMPIDSWSFRKYEGLEFQVIEGTNLQIAPEDILVIPEIFGFVMEQVKNLPCGKIVLCQAYDHVLETLSPGATWQQYGFYKCIATSETQKEEISKIMRNVSFDIIRPTISDCFVKQTHPPKPIILVHTREQREGLNLIKSFYLKYPQFRFFTFRDLRGLSEEEFANAMNDAFLGVWLDSTSSFGTFPIECMASGIPVIGKIPNLKPEWMNEKNGVWVENTLQIVDVIADFAQTWLEDSVLPTLYSEGETTANSYRMTEDFDTEVVRIFNEFQIKRKEFFFQQLNQLNQK
jgi:hypothetical protein